MKRNPRKVKWTKAYRKLAGKELAEVWRKLLKVAGPPSRCCLLGISVFEACQASPNAVR
jgi:hypothetical protein